MRFERADVNDVMRPDLGESAVDIRMATSLTDDHLMLMLVTFESARGARRKSEIAQFECRTRLRGIIFAFADDRMPLDSTGRSVGVARNSRPCPTVAFATNDSLFHTENFTTPRPAARNHRRAPQTPGKCII